MNKKVERHYSITVPVMNAPELGKFGGREAVLAELEKLGATQVLLSLERYVFDRERRGNAMRALKENSDWFKARGLSTGAWLWALWGEEEARPPFCRMTERNGDPGPFFCPLDEDFRKFAADYVADIARTGGRRVRPLHVTGRIRDRAAGDQRTSRRKGKSGRPSEAR